MDLDLEKKAKQKAPEIINLLKNMNYEEANECLYQARRLLEKEAKL